MAGAEHSKGGAGRQAGIVVLLVFVLVGLHAVSTTSKGLDATGLLALGFVVLASYTIGQLVDVIKLPHITGYLLAGLLFGPSVAHMLSGFFGELIPPLDHGILNESAIRQMSVLDTLAVALIAMTAGGELKLATLRRGLGAIVGVLGGQMLAVFVLVTAFVWAISGAIPQIALPGIGVLSTEAALAFGLVVASISIATSPAATIAVVNDTGSEGPMTRTLLSSVVLKDVIVVVAFSLASVFANQAIGQDTGRSDLGLFLAKHILGSLVAGGVVGVAFALYLRYVGREVLLFIIGAVYLGTLLADGLHLDPVLLFIAAGFTVSNFFHEGERFIHNVERLSMPVYVVFFTLAGAKLHLEHLAQVAVFAAVLVGLRVIAFKVGVGLGARLGRADDATQRYGWYGFVSQAGVALSLAAIVGDKLGDTGRALETLIVAGVALNELIGPVLLKVGLTKAGEAQGSRSRISKPDSVPPVRDNEAQKLEAWPEPERKGVSWGPSPNFKSRELETLMIDLRAELQSIIRDLSEGYLSRFQREAEGYLRELRREFLRHHRRLVVQAATREDLDGVRVLVHAEESELAERWRGSALGRAARLRQRGWNPVKFVEDVDRLVGSLPELIDAPYEPETFLSHQGQGPAKAVARSWLRMRRGLNRLIGRELPPRRIELQSVVRYHLSGLVPAKLEGVAALTVEADVHLAARTRSLFDAIVQGYDRLAQPGDEESDAGDAGDPGERSGQLEADLRALRVAVEQELALAQQEVQRMAQDGEHRARQALAEGLAAVVRDLAQAGTLDLPNRRRRSSLVFQRRRDALETTLGRDFVHVRHTVAALYSLLGLELELVGLEARVKDVLDEHVSSLERDVRGRAHVQAQRVETAIEQAMEAIESELDRPGHTGEELGATLRQLAEPLEKTSSEAARLAAQLRSQLGDEQTAAPLLDALRSASEQLTDRYDVPAGRLMRGEWKLPNSVPVIEVPFRHLMSAHIEATLAPRLLSVIRDFSLKVQPFVSSLQEFERLVAFNIELAGGDLDVLHDEIVPPETRKLIKEMVLGALERSREVVGSHIANSADWAPEISQGIRGVILGGVEAFRGELVDGELSQARVDIMRRRAVGQELLRRAEAFPSVVERARAALGRTVRNLLGDERIEQLRRGLGLRVPAQLVPEPAAFETPKPTQRLPSVYRRLFAAETMEANDVLTGREVEIARARRVLSGEDRGSLRCVALVGVDGVGKSALSRAIVRSAGFKGIRAIGLNAPATLEDVEGWFQQKSEGQVYVLSRFYWLMSMHAGGFAPLRRFVEGVIADGGRNAWLLHADRLVWNYACQAAPLADAFPEVIQLESLDAAELEAAVLARHGLSGYGLNFDPQSSRSRIEDFFARSASQIRRPYENYFQALHMASGGLVRDALRLWLASIDEVDESEDFVHVGRVPPSPHAAIRKLPEQVLLNLYQVARQGWMNAKVQSHLFRVDATTAEAQLSRLAHMGLLKQREDGSYRVHAHLRGPLYRVLRERGWTP